jgi:DNA-directed RNA polymerase alpha subunit
MDTVMIGQNSLLVLLDEVIHHVFGIIGVRFDLDQQLLMVLIRKAK